MSLAGKNILVIGASSGIGYNLAQKLVSKGVNVISASRNQPEGLDVEHITLDVSSIEGNELSVLPDTILFDQSNAPC